MRSWMRHLQIVLAALALLWQVGGASAAALAGCCADEQRCCVTATLQASSCHSCVAGVAIEASAPALPPPAAVHASMPTRAAPHRGRVVCEIWRPPTERA